jgi:hypothetical protein
VLDVFGEYIALKRPLGIFEVIPIPGFCLVGDTHMSMIVKKGDVKHQQTNTQALIVHCMLTWNIKTVYV